MRRSQAGLLGATTADRHRETMRERRVERKRAEDIAGYRAAFKLIDMDNDGHVSCPWSLVIDVCLMRWLCSHLVLQRS